MPEADPDDARELLNYRTAFEFVSECLDSGDPITEERASAKSVFHFDVPGSVAKSTHAGLPWLRYLRNQLGDRVHFWPFDGWAIPAGKSAMVKVYP